MRPVAASRLRLWPPLLRRRTGAYLPVLLAWHGRVVRRRGAGRRGGCRARALPREEVVAQHPDQQHHDRDHDPARRTRLLSRSSVRCWVGVFIAASWFEKRQIARPVGRMRMTLSNKVARTAACIARRSALPPARATRRCATTRGAHPVTELHASACGRHGSDTGALDDGIANPRRSR